MTQVLKSKETFLAVDRGTCEYEEWSERYNIAGCEDGVRGLRARNVDSL